MKLEPVLACGPLTRLVWLDDDDDDDDDDDGDDDGDDDDGLVKMVQ